MNCRLTNAIIVDHCIGNYIFRSNKGLRLSKPSSDQAPMGVTVAALVERLLTSKSQEAMIAVLRAEPRPETSKALAAEVKTHVTILHDYIRNNRAPEAIATALAMLFIDADHAVACIRREGVMRASSYGFRGALIGRVARVALSVRDLFPASADRIAYLESVDALTRLAGNVLKLQEEMERTIRSHRTKVLKTVFVMINSLFYRGWLNDPEASSLDGGRYSSEEYAEAASLVLRTYCSMLPIDDGCFNYADTDANGKNAVVYHRLLLAAIRITKFREAELFIDGLPYRADCAGEKVTISSINPDVERSLRIGYIQGQGQAMIRVEHLRATVSALSMKDMIDRGFECGSFGKMLELVEEPVRRFRLKLPAVPEVFDAFFSRDELLRDEMEMLLTLDVDNFGTIDQMIFPITEGVTTLDVFKVQRYFNFLSSAYQRRLADVADPAERAELTLNSTVLAIPHGALLDQLKLILKDEAKCRTVIEMLKMNPTDAHLDLQYRPFVDTGNFYVIAPHVVAVSNLVRNMIIANRLRSAAIGPKDRMVHAVGEALCSAGFDVETGFEGKIAGKPLELDVVARRDGSLFLFECKNAYHPVSVHEMRNSWDHVRGARKQLDLRHSVLSDPANQAELFKRLGWKVGSPSDVYTCIVIANRVFHGASLNKHPIRQAHELINVLTNGRLVAYEDSLSLWLGPGFQTNDLIGYLGPDSIAAGQLAALDPWEWSYALGYRELAFSTYVLDPVKFDRQVRERYGPPIPGGRRSWQEGIPTT